MIDTFQAKTKSKKLYLLNEGAITKIGEDQGKGKKPKLIDMAFGDFNGIVQDLKSQGYELIIIKSK